MNIKRRTREDQNFLNFTVTFSTFDGRLEKDWELETERDATV